MAKKRHIDAEWLDRTLVTSSNYYMLCTTEKQFMKALKHLNTSKSDRPPFVSDWSSNATAHTFENRTEGEVSTVVCIKGYETRTLEQTYALLAHEAMHIWQEIKANYGETNPSAEFEAYSVQNICQNLMEEFKRQTS